MGVSSLIFYYTITICDTVFALLSHKHCQSGLIKDGRNLQDLEA